MISDERFRKSEHILKSKDFRVIYKKGNSVKVGPLVLSYLPNGLLYSRLGFSISSRTVKLASNRNRIKRIFREIYRKEKKSVKKGFDIVIIIRRNLPRPIQYKDMKDMFFKAIKTAGIS